MNRKMNRKQLAVLWIGILILAGMCIYPPWVVSGDLSPRSWDSDCFQGPYLQYGWVWRAWLWRDIFLGSDYGRSWTKTFAGPMTVDLRRLACQGIAVALLTTGGILTFSERPDAGKPG